jgi:hypothetical protein
MALLVFKAYVVLVGLLVLAHQQMFLDQYLVIFTLKALLVMSTY